MSLKKNTVDILGQTTENIVDNNIDIVANSILNELLAAVPVVSILTSGYQVFNEYQIAKRAKHITTTAKIPHPYEYVHDETAYNYRLPNINAALLVAQLEQLEKFLASKRELAKIYKEFFLQNSIKFIEEPENSKSNYWLQAVLLENVKQRDDFLEFTNKNGVMTRPIWKLMNELEMFKDCQKTDLKNAKYLEERVVNIPSSVRVN